MNHIILVLSGALIGAAALLILEMVILVYYRYDLVETNVDENSRFVKTADWIIFKIDDTLQYFLRWISKDEE